MKPTNLKGLKRLIAAWHNSKVGLREAWKREESFRQETIALALAIPAAFWVSSSLSQLALLLGSVLLLMIVEILNSAIEAIVDRIGLERHDLSRIAKDLGSAAVFLAALFPLCIWGAVILEKIGLLTL